MTKQVCRERFCLRPQVNASAGLRFGCGHRRMSGGSLAFPHREPVPSGRRRCRLGGKTLVNTWWDLYLLPIIWPESGNCPAASFRRLTRRGCSSVGRALPCQGRCREFESLRPLQPFIQQGFAAPQGAGKGSGGAREAALNLSKSAPARRRRDRGHRARSPCASAPSRWPRGPRISPRALGQ